MTPERPTLGPFIRYRVCRRLCDGKVVAVKPLTYIVEKDHRAARGMLRQMAPDLARDKAVELVEIENPASLECPVFMVTHDFDGQGC